MRPVSLLALSESEENVEFLMDTTINPETIILQTTGIQLTAGKFDVNITRCLFDAKMAAILDGAGSASCHLCTCSRDQLKDIELITHQCTMDFANSFPIKSFWAWKT